MTASSRSIVAGPILLATLVLAGCSGGRTAPVPPPESGPASLPPVASAASPGSVAPSDPSGEASASTSASPSVYASSSSAASGSPSPGGSPSVSPAAGAACPSSALRLRLGRADGAAGSSYQPLIFTNAGTAACTLTGFPGVSFVTGESGTQVGAAAQRQTGGRAAAVLLAPGGEASAVVQKANTANFDEASCAPVPVRGYRVFPPGQRGALFVPLTGETACSAAGVEQLGVAPVEAGALG